MESHAQLLEECGLSPNEAKVSLALLELGASSAGPVAKYVHLHRPNVYQALQRLMDRGLISYIGSGNIRMFSAGSPERLLTKLKEQEQRVEQLLPQLLIRQQLAKQGQVQVFEGLPATRHLFDQWLDIGKSIHAFGIPENARTLLGPFIEQFHRRRIQRKIPMQHIYNENARERIHQLNAMPLTEARYVPKEYNSVSSTNVCGDTVTIIHWSASPLIIQITNAEIAESYHRYFQLLWNLARAE